MFRRSRCFFAVAFDPFATLGVSPSTATRDSVKQKYRELAMKYHPDSGTSANSEKMESINRAYNMLIKEGMVDQVRSSSSASAAKSTSDFSTNFNNNNSNYSDAAYDQDTPDDDPEVVAKLDPGTERISDDGSQFLYLNRETNQWVRRRRPISRPQQARYTTFSQQKTEPQEHVVDLHHDIRRRAMSMQVSEESRTRSFKFVRHFRDQIPFDHPVLVALWIVIFMYTTYLLWHRIQDKKYLFDDKREFYYDKRFQREMVEQAFETFDTETLLAAEAAMLREARWLLDGFVSSSFFVFCVFCCVCVVVFFQFLLSV